MVLPSAAIEILQTNLARNALVATKCLTRRRSAQGAVKSTTVIHSVNATTGRFTDPSASGRKVEEFINKGPLSVEVSTRRLYVFHSWRTYKTFVLNEKNIVESKNEYSPNSIAGFQFSSPDEESYGR